MNYKEKFLETINKIAKDEVNKVEINQCYLNVLESQDKEIERLNNIINELSEKNRNLIEDNMRLRKEINLHSGKLVITDLEVKEVWK